MKLPMIALIHKIHHSCGIKDCLQNKRLVKHILERKSIRFEGSEGFCERCVLGARKNRPMYAGEMIHADVVSCCRDLLGVQNILYLIKMTSRVIESFLY